MVTTSKLLLFALLIPLTGAATAQTGETPEGTLSARVGMTLQQFIAKQSERIMAADTDGDGKVSRAEMSAAASGGRDPSRLFDLMDTNHDGYLDGGEIRAALTRRFRRVDANGDGIVTPEERMAVRQRRKAMQAGASKTSLQQ